MRDLDLFAETRTLVHMVAGLLQSWNHHPLDLVPETLTHV